MARDQQAYAIEYRIPVSKSPYAVAGSSQFCGTRWPTAFHRSHLNTRTEEHTMSMGDDDVIIATIESQHLAPVTEKIHERTAQQHNDEESHHSPDSANSSPPSPTERKKTWAQRIEILGSLSAWYIFGIVAIVTSKILVQEWKCPPLVLTVQQMILGNTILRVVLSARSNVQPWPWESS